MWGAPLDIYHTKLHQTMWAIEDMHFQPYLFIFFVANLYHKVFLFFIFFVELSGAREWRNFESYHYPSQLALCSLHESIENSINTKENE